MHRYTYTGEPGRYYPTLAVTPVPGETYPLERKPRDGRWQTPDDKPEPAPEAPVKRAARLHKKEEAGDA